MRLMRGRPPIVQKCMTRLPVEAENCETVADALRVMESHGIRHIPVMSGAHLSGLVSDHDILQAQLTYGDRANDMVLEDICQKDVLSVGPMTSINDVARAMLARKVGSAVVVDGGYVVGIFTTTDALRVLQNLSNI